MKPEELEDIIFNSDNDINGGGAYLHVTDCLIKGMGVCHLVGMEAEDFRKLSVQEYFEWSQKS